MKKILIVEDDESNRELLREILQSGGYRVIEARNGIEAIEKAKSDAPDLIIMDIQLPGMDGIAAMKKINELMMPKNIPIIALTGYAMKGDKGKFLSEGFADYLSKPVNFTALLETVKKIT